MIPRLGFAMPEWLGVLIGLGIGLFAFVYLWPLNDLGESLVAWFLRRLGMDRPRAGGEVIPGTRGELVRPFAGGVARVVLLAGPHRGESWRARAVEPVPDALNRAGGRVRVTGVRGATLEVIILGP